MRIGTKKAAAADSYLKLVVEFALRPIRSNAEYDRAAAIVDRLALRGEDDLDAGESDYLDALSVFIEKYDDDHYPVDSADVSGREVLQHLIESSEMTRSELGQVLGVGPAVATMIAAGKRPITADHARALGKRFGVEPGLFITFQ